MRILLTADLHANVPIRLKERGTRAIEQFAAAVREVQPDAVVVAGDIADVYWAHDCMLELREAVGDRPLAVCLGNHDYWVQRGRDRYDNLEAILQEVWRPICAQFGAILLDVENADWGDFTVVGGYGHYYLGLAIPDLEFGGTPITRENYLEGGIGRVFWNDFRMIPHCAEHLETEARAQAAGIRQRLAAATSDGRRVIVATHTLPWDALNGFPRRGSELDMLAAYNGNAQVGEVMAEFAPSIDLLVCGHTHRRVEERPIAGIPRCLNLGADYGVFAGIVFDTENSSITWIGG